MSKTETVEVLKPFNKTAQGDLADVGGLIEVDATRADELVRNGLAKRKKAAEPVAKAAPAPENKMAPAPANKAHVAGRGDHPKRV
jgi:hypothetical protein